MTIPERVPAALTAHPAVSAVELAGSRAEGRATEIGVQQHTGGVDHRTQQRFAGRLRESARVVR